MTTFTGHMVHADWDGQTLHIEGHNKLAKKALAGAAWEQPVVLDRSEIQSVNMTEPNGVISMGVNGHVEIWTTDGRKFWVHFRRKSFDQMRAMKAA